MHADPFLQAILAAPDDDAPRLLYAEWLEERGETARAAFIRVQCALAGMMGTLAPPCTCASGRPADPRCPSWTWQLREQELRRRERELLNAKVGVAAASPLWPLFADGVLTGNFRRGFVERLACTAAAWLAHADALYWHPDQGRPFVPTAQPLAAVRLTTWPDVISWATTDGLRQAHLAGRRAERIFPAIGTLESVVILDLLAAEWRRIEFALPEYGPSPVRGAYGAWRQMQQLLRVIEGRP